MGEIYRINGGRELYGKVDLHGAKNAVLPMIALYATGIATAGVFLVGGAVSLFYRFWRLTRVGHKYYDNRNSIDKVDKQGDK